VDGEGTEAQAHDDDEEEQGKEEAGGGGQHGGGFADGWLYYVRELCRDDVGDDEAAVSLATVSVFDG
jgi:hypothetical protein